MRVIRAKRCAEFSAAAGAAERRRKRLGANHAQERTFVRE